MAGGPAAQGCAAEDLRRAAALLERLAQAASDRGLMEKSREYGHAAEVASAAARAIPRTADDAALAVVDALWSRGMRKTLAAEALSKAADAERDPDRAAGLRRDAKAAQWAAL